MPGRFPFQHLSKYPHMKPEDVAVWERFIEAKPTFFDSVDYDVRCGIGAETNPDHPPEIQYDHTVLTQKKIDVVGYKNDLIYIVEVGPIADMRKLGQILTYTKLYKADHPDIDRPVPMVLCREIERELADLFDDHAVTIETA